MPVLGGANGYRGEIVRNRLGTRRLTEKTNLNLRYRKKPAVSRHHLKEVVHATQVHTEM